MKFWLWSADRRVHKSTYRIVDRLKYGFATSEEGLVFAVSADSKHSNWRSLYSIP